MKPIVGTLSISLIVIGVMLHLICWRHKNLAWMILYFECIWQVVYNLVPTNLVFFSNTNRILNMAIILIMTGNNRVSDIFPCAISTVLQDALCKPLITLDGFTSEILTATVINLIGCIIICILNNMVLTYIARLLRRIAQLLEENLKLLDKIQEGVIIVTK